jgi:transmembrane sensor
MTDSGTISPNTDDSARLAAAVEWFLRLRSESAGVEELPEFQQWAASDPRNAAAYRQVSATWRSVGEHASAAEIVVARRDALEDARRAGGATQPPLVSRRRFAVVAAIAAASSLGVGSWFIARREQSYSTGLGERRTLTLDDGSVVTLDARSRVAIRYSSQERQIALKEGQARFDVAKDPRRPFRVHVRNQTVVALGTQFNVEIVSGTILVTLLEGHVAVSAASQRGAPVQAPIQIRPGQQLVVSARHERQILTDIDVNRATAWQTGKMFFDNEPLGAAAERVNRYARQQIIVDPDVADVAVSGIFNTGDSGAFIEGITAYFPVRAEHLGTSEIRLSARH